MNINCYISDKPDPYEVHSSFINPFDPPNLIHWMICPTHEVHNDNCVAIIHFIIDIRVEGLETASRERISGVTNRVCLTTATTRFPCSSLKNFVGLNLRSGSISWCIMILISSV